MVFPFLAALGGLVFLSLLPANTGTAIVGTAVCLVLLVSTIGMVGESLQDA